MKILIDIGHPAHVHYFKNFIWLMQKEGHTINIVARDKEVVFSLLDFYKLPYFNRGKGKKGFIGKLVYMLQADLFIFKKALSLRPDLYISAGSMYAAHVAWITRKPHIALDDTDHNAFQHLMYVPFTKVILTPEVFQKKFGKNHFRFDGFLELGSLHPNWFVPNAESVQKVLNHNEKYIILRFVSWEATHDVGLKGLSLMDKYKLVENLSKYARVIISSEGDLPEDLMRYGYKTHPALMHDLINGASLLIGESVTMSAEAAFIGTPTICITTANAGTLDEEVRLGLIELYRTSDGIIERAVEILKNETFKEAFKLKSTQITKSKVDLTAFLIWFTQNYPQSLNQMQMDSNAYKKFIN
jgi:predicted glycosyltransferase